MTPDRIPRIREEVQPAIAVRVSSVVAGDPSCEELAFIRLVCARSLVREPLVQVQRAEVVPFLGRNAGGVGVVFVLLQHSKAEGFASVAAIRREPALDGMRVILVGQVAAAADVDRAVDLRADGFLLVGSDAGRAAEVLGRIVAETRGPGR